MNKEVKYTAEDEEEIDLREVFSVFWEGRFIIVAGLMLSAILGGTYALNLPNKYTADALLAPRAEGAASGRLASLASQYSGLAGLAGIDLGGIGGNNKAMIAMELLKSREFFGEYLYEIVLVDLMASKTWDFADDMVLYDASIYEVETGEWVREVEPGRQSKPSVQEAHKNFLPLMTVSEDSKTGFVSIAVTHFSPRVARDWVTLIILGVNDAIRARDVEEAEKSIAFLNEQRSMTSLVSLTEVFAALIEEQTKTVMLARASDEYVFQVIEPPVISEERSEPSRGVIVIVIVMVGGLITLLLLFVRNALGKNSNAPPSSNDAKG